MKYLKNSFMWTKRGFYNVIINSHEMQDGMTSSKQMKYKNKWKTVKNDKRIIEWDAGQLRLEQKQDEIRKRQ